jgi:mono/diheme cytochrome c family protein
MAEVVFRSTQYLTPEDLKSMALFIKELPASGPARPPEVERADRNSWQAGEKIYADRCADCHGKQGEGLRKAYPALAGNRSVMLSSPNNVIKAILYGGFPPSTAGNPMPYGMPPFGQNLKDEEVAAVASYIRQAWGQMASPVSALDVYRAR